MSYITIFIVVPALLVGWLVTKVVFRRLVQISDSRLVLATPGVNFSPEPPP